MKFDVAVLGRPYGLCGGKATSELRGCVKVEMAVLGRPVPNSPYGLCGCKATLNLNSKPRFTAACSREERCCEPELGSVQMGLNVLLAAQGHLRRRRLGEERSQPKHRCHPQSPGEIKRREVELGPTITAAEDLGLLESFVRKAGFALTGNFR